MIYKEKFRFGLREAAVLRKRKEPKTKKSIALTLRRDLQGSAAEKLRMFEKVRAGGGFAKVDPAALAEAARMLREFVAMERELNEDVAWANSPRAEELAVALYELVRRQSFVQRNSFR